MNWRIWCRSGRISPRGRITGSCSAGLLRRFGRDVWVERSGGTLLQAARLLTEFPEARVIHIYRDGRDTAISMSRHHPFRVIVATLRAQQRWGIDALRSNAPGNRWDRLSPWLVPVSNALFPPRRLPFDQLELADFGRFWSRMIARGQVQFQRLPPDRFLAVKFEDVAAEPEKGLRRIIRFIAPELEDEGWLRACGGRGAPRAIPLRRAPRRRTGAVDRSLPSGAGAFGVSGLTAAPARPPGCQHHRGGVKSEIGFA